MKAKKTTTHIFLKSTILVVLFLASGCLAEKPAVTTTTQPESTASITKNQLSEKQLRTLLSDGIELKLGGASEGYHGQLSLYEDGRGEGWAITDSGRRIEINGNWEIKNNEFCRTWREVNSGKTVCEKWISMGDNKVEVYSNNKKIGVNSWE